jgi:FKBP-type peptidyl-prolyl cis-trans isomerase
VGGAKTVDGLLEESLRNNMTTQGELKQLVIDDVRVGTGVPVENGDLVTVNYIGTTKDGVQFDNSYVRGVPFSFTLGGGKVIKGWEEGLIGMKVGGQRILVIPPDMAYGNAQVGPIPANSVLVFTIELLTIKK